VKHEACLDKWRNAYAIRPPSAAGTNLLSMKRPVKNETSPEKGPAGAPLKLQLNLGVAMSVQKK
jgi:hypothetical protein